MLPWAGPGLAPCFASYHHHRSLAHCSRVSLPVPYDTPMPGLTFPAYFALSSSLTALAVSYAFHSRSQFYPAVIYLVTSKLSVLVLGNMGESGGGERDVRRREGVGSVLEWWKWTCLRRLPVPLPLMR